MEGKDGGPAEAEVLVESVIDLFADEQGGDDEELRDDELAYGEDAAKAGAAGAASGAVMLILQDLHWAEAREQEGGPGACEQCESWDEQRQEEEAAGVTKPVGVKIGGNEAGEGFDEHGCEGHGEDGRE